MVIPLPASEPTVVGADMLLPLCDKPALVESLVGAGVVVGFAVGASEGVDSVSMSGAERAVRSAIGSDCCPIRTSTH